DGADWLDLRSGHNDVALLAFLSSVEQGDTSCRQVWESWQLREGRETYAYMTLDQLLTAFVVHSAEADTDTVLLPVHVGDIRRIDQHYYNRSSPSGWPTPSPMPNSLCCFKTYPATMWPHCDRHPTRCPTTVAKPACPACIRRSTRETTGHDRGRTQAGTSRRHKADSPSTQGRLPRDRRQHRNGHLLRPTRYRLLRSPSNACGSVSATNSRRSPTSPHPPLPQTRLRTSSPNPRPPSSPPDQTKPRPPTHC